MDLYSSRRPQGEFNHLIDSSADDREQGRTDTYEIDGPEIQPITRIGFRMVKSTQDTNWRWYCEKVEVEDLTTGYSVYIEDFGWINDFDKVFWKNT